MSTKWQKIDISIPKDYSPIERQAIALEVIKFIRKRTQNDNKDKDGKPFAGYSEAYKQSINFKIAGKSKGTVDLTLSGDMLGALDVLKTRKGEITIGFERGSPENAKADGNIRGTYGKPKPVGPRRDFLGLKKSELARILKGFEPGDIESAKVKTATPDDE